MNHRRGRPEDALAFHTKKDNTGGQSGCGRKRKEAGVLSDMGIPVGGRRVAG